MYFTTTLERGFSQTCNKKIIFTMKKKMCLHWYWKKTNTDRTILVEEEQIDQSFKSLNLQLLVCVCVCARAAVLSVRVPPADSLVAGGKWRCWKCPNWKVDFALVVFHSVVWFGSWQLRGLVCQAMGFWNFTTVQLWGGLSNGWVLEPSIKEPGYVGAWSEYPRFTISWWYLLDSQDLTLTSLETLPG